MCKILKNILYLCRVMLYALAFRSPSGGSVFATLSAGFFNIFASMKNIVIRPIEERDHKLLEEFLYQAIFVPDRPDGAGHEDWLMIRELC